MKKQSTAGSAIFVLTRLSNVSYLLTDLFFFFLRSREVYLFQAQTISTHTAALWEANANNCVKAFVAVLLKTLLATFI